MKINLTIKDGIKVEQLEKIGAILEGLPDGLYEVYIGKPRRTPRQNKFIHAAFAEIANHFEALGTSIKIEVAPTPASIKEKFKQEYLLGKTSRADTKELSTALDTFIRNLNTFLRENGAEEIILKDRDTINLLQTYAERNLEN